jgi:hypothetical protein
MRLHCQQTAIAHSRKTNAIAFFKPNHKMIALSPYSDRVKAIAPKKNNMVKYFFELYCFYKSDLVPEEER